MGIRYELDEMSPIIALWRDQAIAKVDAPEMELGYEGVLMNTAIAEAEDSVAMATAMNLAVAGIVVAAASNNLIKGFYAFSIAGGKTGRQALFLLAAFAALGLLPLAF